MSAPSSVGINARPVSIDIDGGPGSRDNIHGKDSILDRDDTFTLMDQLQDALRHQRRSAREPRGTGPFS
ncbi:hypothetical protein [Rhodococcus koreensis]|uniref:hypothetical protein n=1 Tax=Rhodococcus koreensis TaxID=99653 RepID=UPI00366AE91D